MRPIQIHPFSAVAGMVGGAALVVCIGMQTPTNVKRVTALTAEQEEILSHLSIEFLDDGLAGTVKTIRLSDANFQIVSGSGATNGYPTDPDDVDTINTTTNGLGNLIVGYLETGNPLGDNRSGSHNVVLGHSPTYTSYGGIIGGRDNRTFGAYANALGQRNLASGDYSGVYGGRNNTASADETAVLAGSGNTASGQYAAVLGGASNQATFTNTCISGGNLCQATGNFATVTGGEQNIAAGNGSTISGGRLNDTSANYAWVGGGENNLASNFASTVAGGQDNTSSGSRSHVCGGDTNTASHSRATVSGGNTRSSIDADDWVGGSLREDT